MNKKCIGFSEMSRANAKRLRGCLSRKYKMFRITGFSLIAHYSYFLRARDPAAIPQIIAHQKFLRRKPTNFPIWYLQLTMKL